MPLLLLVPFLTFVLIVSGVRARRATSNMTVLGLLVAVATFVLVAWARWRARGAYVTTYQWINVPTSFAGAPQFQGFGIDISFRVDHIALAVGAAILLSTIGVVTWHRFTGRGEAGPARFHAELMLAATAAIGVLVSGDLAALAAWWGLAGAASYLLLAHRWGTEAAGRASRIGLWLPFVGDLALWCAVALIYSRFGQLDVDKLAAPTVLHGTYQAGLRSLTAAAILFGVAALVRGGVFPFTAWQTALDAPPAAAAWMQATWPAMALVMLARVLPIFDAAGPEGYRVFAYLCALGVAGGALLSLLVNDLRRSAAWAGSALVALAMLGLGQPGALATSIAGMVVLTLARPVVAGAAWAITAAMRSRDLTDMGGTWRRMRRTSAGYLVAAVALALAFVPKAAARGSSGWRGSWFLAAALVVVGIALLRPYAAAAHGELRRRRAFEPTRVREVAPGAWTAGLALAAAAAIAVVLAFLTPWVDWLATRGHPAGVEQMFVWLVPALVGCGIGFAAAAFRRDTVIGWSALTHELVSGYSGLAVLAADRFLGRPLVGLVRALEGGAVDGGGTALGGSLGIAGTAVRASLARGGGGALGFALLAIAVAVVVVGVLAGSGR